MTAIESIFCCRWAWIAVATPKRPDHERDQADQRQKRGRLPQALFDQRMRFAVVGDQCVAENLVQIIAHDAYLQGWRNFEQKTFRRAAACDEQAGPG